MLAACVGDLPHGKAGSDVLGRGCSWGCETSGQLSKAKRTCARSSLLPPAVLLTMMKPPVHEYLHFPTTSHPSKLGAGPDSPMVKQDERRTGWGPGLILPQLSLARGRCDTSRQSLRSLCPVSPPPQPPTSHFTSAVALLTCH